MFENKWVVFLLRAGVRFPRGDTGSPFFCLSIFVFPIASSFCEQISPFFRNNP